MHQYVSRTDVTDRFPHWNHVDTNNTYYSFCIFLILATELIK